MRRRGLPLGHELRGSLPVVSSGAEKSLAASGSGLHAPGFQAARNHAPDRGETLHLHRQLHHASAAPGNHPYLTEPSTPSPALLSPASCYLAANLPLCLLLFSVSHFFTFLCVPQPTFSPPCPGGCDVYWWRPFRPGQTLTPSCGNQLCHLQVTEKVPCALSARCQHGAATLSSLPGAGSLSSDSSGEQRLLSVQPAGREAGAAVGACGSDLPQLQRGMTWEMYFHTSRKNKALSGELTSKVGGSFSDPGPSWLGCTMETDSAAKVMEISGTLLSPRSSSVPLS